MKPKHIILTILLSLFVVSGLWAQEKYEYAIIYLEKGTFNSGAGLTATRLCVFDDSNNTCDKIDKDNSEQKLIQKVEEFNDRGWEVYQSNTSSIGLTYQFTYYLRKKKN